MNKISYKVVFNRKNKLNKDGKALIQIECYLNGKRKYISTGIKIDPVYWNKSHRIVKKNHSTSVELNRIISQQIRKIENLEFRIFEKNGDVSLSDIDKIKNEGNQDNDFLKFCFESLESNTAVERTTITQHRTMLNKLKTYRENITFRAIDYSLIKGFDDFLRNSGLHQNTIANQHKTFKTYINLAIKKGLFSADDYPYKNFKVKKVQAKRPFLTLAEVDAIKKIKFTENTRHIERVRDMFVFSCYSGLRFSDVQKIKNKHITIGDDGYVIEMRQQKTKDYVKLPISLLFEGKAVEIVKKYESDFQEQFLFPRISNQKANSKLKVVQLVAGIDKVISFHISRHTFGTNLAVATSDQFLIKELMGHADINTSMIYIHISQEQIRDKLKNTKW